MTKTIYALVDPRTNKVRYVGAAKDVTRRVAQHFIGDHCRSTQLVQEWLTELTTNQLDPSWKTLETVDDFLWSLQEQKWIKFYKAKGEADLNTIQVMTEARKLALAEGRRNSPNCKSKVVYRVRIKDTKEVRDATSLRMKQLWIARKAAGYKKPELTSDSKKLISSNMKRIWAERRTKEDTTKNGNLREQENKVLAS